MLFKTLSFLRLDFIFIVFLVLSDKVSQHTHLIIVVLIEVEAVPMSKSDLEKVVVQALLGNSYNFGGFLQ